MATLASGPAMEAVLMWGGLATVATAVGGAAWRVALGLVRTGRRVDDFMDDWAGKPERPGVPATPGLMERVGRIEDEQASLRGAVDRVNRTLSRLCPDCDDQDQAPGG
jgi:hypothetical protein